MILTLVQAEEITPYGILRLALQNLDTDKGDDDALEAMTRAIDRGLRWTGFFDLAAFDSLRTSLAFQTELARMQELAEADRNLILSELCAPDSSLSGWTPAPESCGLWRQQESAVAAPI